MIATFEFGDGCFPDVGVKPDGRWLLAYREGDPRQPGQLLVRMEGEGSPIYAAAVGPGPAFPRIYWPWLAYVRDGAGGLVHLITGATVDLGPLYGNDPLALSSRWCAFQASASAIWLRDLRDGGGPILGLSPRPTGILSVSEGGVVVRVDDVRTSQAGMLNPRTAGNLTVGECDPPAALCRLQDGHTLRLWPGLDSFVPHCATDGTRYFVATWGSQRVRLAIVTAEDFAAPVTTPVLADPNLTIDMLPFFVGGEWPHTSKLGDSSGTLDLIVNEAGKPKTFQFVKWQNPACLEVYRYDDTTVYHHQDSTDPASEGGAAPYHFTEGRWVSRLTRVGDVIDCPANHLQRFRGGVIVQDAPVAYRVTVDRHYSAFDCGGDVGVREVVVLKYDPTMGNPGHGCYEYQWFAAGWGWWKWQAFRASDDTLAEEAIMNLRGGTRVTPAPLMVPLPGETPMPSAVIAPGITVDSFGRTLTPSSAWSLQFHDRNGSGFISVEVKIEKQRLVIHATNAAGQDTTGAVRIVTVQP